MKIKNTSLVKWLGRKKMFVTVVTAMAAIGTVATFAVLGFSGTTYVPLERMRLDQTGQIPSYFYTTYSSQMQQAKTSGWKVERYEGLLQQNAAADTQPLHWLQFTVTGKTYNFYTASDDEVALGLKAGWKEVGTMGYIASKQLPGTVPLHRLYFNRPGQFGGFFYTIDQSQVDLAKAAGWIQQVDTGYVWTPAKPKIDVYGHSIAYGYGATNPAAGGYASLVGSMLGAQINNQAIPGSSIFTAAGYPKILQVIHPVRTQAPYTAPGQFGLLHYGQNDLSSLGTANLRPFQEGMRTAIARYQAGAVFEEDSGSVSYQGQWKKLGGCYATCSGSNMMYTTQVGDGLTITVPDDFPGGTITFGTAVASNGAGALWDFTVDGSSAGNWDTRNGNAPGHPAGYVKQFGNLSSGKHVIRATVTATPGFAAFDYWQIQDPTPPPVLLVTSVKAASYGLYLNSAYPETDNAVVAIDNILSSLATQFPNIQVVNIENTLGKNPIYFTADGLHPNNLGYYVLANALVNQLYAPYVLQ